MTKTAQKRPSRADYIAERTTRETEMQCDKMVAVVDRLAIQMSEKWGEDRLPELVSVETARKYGAALAKLNSAIAAQLPDEVEKRAGVCIRGLKAMDAEAEAAGQPKASGDFWQIPGTNFAVMKDGMEWRACKAQRDDLVFVSLQEVLTALQACKLDNPMFAEIKKHFPQSEIRPLKKPLIDDEIPW